MSRFRVLAVLGVAAGLTVAPVVTPVWASPKPVAPAVHEIALTGVDKPALATSPTALDPTTLEAQPGVAPAAQPKRADTDQSPRVFTGEIYTGRFTAAGVRWAAASTPPRLVIQVRVREKGSWTDWKALDQAEASGESAGEGQKAVETASTEPLVSPDADAIQVRIDCDGPIPANLKLVTVDPGTSGADSNLKGTPGASASAAAAAPNIISRAAWGADESLRSINGPCPGYTGDLKVGFVHHTVSTNDYAPSDSAGMVRGIYAYHINGNGWCDLGYNFLADKYGQVFEGRYGGVDRPVKGAHTLGFNDNSFSVSAIGDYRTAATPAPMLDAMGKVLGWKLSLYRVDPMGTSVLTSAGGSGAKWPAGTQVTFNNISGHRDAYATECPGSALYSQLPTLRTGAANYVAQTGNNSVTLVGHGYGHGNGLGQYGAYGYAVDQGWTWQMILDHYYSGSSSSTIPSENISVELMNTDAGAWFTSGRTFKVGDPANPGGALTVGGGSGARLVWTGSSWIAYTTYNGCAAPNNYGPYAVNGSSVWLESDPGPTAGEADLLKTCSTGNAYRGSFRAAWTGSTVRMVNDVPMEWYLRSVVPSESSPSWGDARGGWGINALMAQAVAARSYAASQNRNGYAKTCDTTTCQVYPGAFRNGTPVEHDKTNAAVVGTAGVVRRMPNGAVASTQFSSSTGGYTGGGSFNRVEDQGDSRSPNHTWTTQLNGDSLASFYGVGLFRQMLITEQISGGPEGGRVKKLKIIGTAGEKTVTGPQFRTDWGLKSDWFFPVVQSIQQITSTAYIKHAYSDTVYRQFALDWNGWSDHAPMTWSEYVAAGYPTPTTVATDYVKYPWSPAIYAVTFWPGEPSWQWKQLTYAEWEKAGWPKARTAGFIYGTMYYTVGSSPVIYAQSPDDVVHALTYQEWKDAGYPPPVRR